MSERMARKKQWSKCSGDEIAWIGMDVKFSSFIEIADWLQALAHSGGCGFSYPGDAFCDSTNSLANWMSCLADKIRKAGTFVEEQHEKAKWLNGKHYECEFAYCSKCGRMEWAGWTTHNRAKEKVVDFFNDYKFCPECGSEMEGGEYVE